MIRGSDNLKIPCLKTNLESELPIAWVLSHDNIAWFDRRLKGLQYRKYHEG